MFVIVRFAIIGLCSLALTGCLNTRSQGLGANSGILKYNTPPAKIENDVIGANALRSSFSEKLKASDLSHLQQAQKTAFEQEKGGIPIAWKNPKTRHSGEVTSGTSYTINGRLCRNFVNSIIIDDKRQTEDGIVCLERDGLWQALFS